MIKRYYTAYVMVSNGEGKKDVQIFSGYESREEAEDGIRRFVKQYEGSQKVITTWTTATPSD